MYIKWSATTQGGDGDGMRLCVVTVPEGISQGGGVEFWNVTPCAYLNSVFRGLLGVAVVQGQ